MPFAALAPFLPYILSGLGAVGGALGGRRGDRTQTTTIQEPPESLDVRSILGDIFQQRLGPGREPFAFPPEMLQGGIADINRQSDLSRQSLGNRMRRLGLGDSPIAGAGEISQEMGRFGEIQDLRNQMSIQEQLLGREFEQQDIQSAINFLFSGRPGMTTTGPGSVTGGAFGSAGSMLGLLMTLGAFPGIPGMFGGGTPKAGG